MTVNFSTYYERLCALVVLGLADTQTEDQGDVYAEFKEHLVRSPDNWYENICIAMGREPP